MYQQQHLQLQASNILLSGIQINQLIGHSEGESEVASSSEDLEVEEDDG